MSVKIKSLVAALVVSLTMLVTSCSKNEEEAVQQPKEQTVGVELKVPDTTWGVHIEDVYQVDSELWVVSKVEQQAGEVMGAAVVSTVKDEVVVPTEAQTIKHFVVGKTWDWANEEPYTFLTGTEEIQDKLTGATKLDVKRG